jgi:hypothetical protein
LSQKTCIEKWNLSSEKLGGKFYDKGRNVSAALSAGPVADCVVGFASQKHKFIEGKVYAASGRVVDSQGDRLHEKKIASG